MKRGLLVLLCMLMIVGIAMAEGRRWEGTAAPGRYGEFPESGNFAASNSFPLNSRVEVEHLATGRTTTAFVTRELDEPGVLVLLSPDAALELGLERDAEVRVRRIDRATPPAGTRGPEPALSSDPDRNPLAALETAPEDMVPADSEAPRLEPVPGAPETTEAEPKPDREPRALSELPRIPVPEDTVPSPVPSPAELETDLDRVPDPVIAIDEDEFAATAREPVEEEPELGLRPRVSERPVPGPLAIEDEPPREEAPRDEPEREEPPREEPEREKLEREKLEPSETEPEGPELAARPTAPDPETPHLEPSVEPEAPPAVPTPEPEPEPEPAVVPTDEPDLPEFPGPDAVLSLEPSEERPPEGPPTLEPVEPSPDPEPTPAPPSPPAPSVTGVLEPGMYYVQLGAFTSREGAGVLVSGLDTRYPSTIVDGRLNGRQVYRVYLGPLSEDEAGAALYTARRRGYRDAFVTRP